MDISDAQVCVGTYNHTQYYNDFFISSTILLDSSVEIEDFGLFTVRQINLKPTLSLDVVNYKIGIKFYFVGFHEVRDNVPSNMPGISSILNRC